MAVTAETLVDVMTATAMIVVTAIPHHDGTTVTEPTTAAARSRLVAPTEREMRGGAPRLSGTRRRTGTVTAMAVSVGRGRSRMTGARMIGRGGMIEQGWPNKTYQTWSNPI
jgi:hypothetical protein